MTSAADSILALLKNSPQNYQSQQDDQQDTSNPVQQSQQPQAQQSWVADLIANHSAAGNARIKRTPVGFDFKSIHFDPSSYYRALGTFRDVSRLATTVTETEAANRQQAELERQQAADKAAANSALGGISANFTYDGVSRKYHLKGIASDVGTAADALGSKFGIKTVYGKGPGSVPGSDHPKGLALDFMINNTSNGKARGTQLANYVISNYKALNVKYVIWYDYIWHPGRGWSKYSGPSNHEDHVHVSFNS